MFVFVQTSFATGLRQTKKETYSWSGSIRESMISCFSLKQNIKLSTKSKLWHWKIWRKKFSPMIFNSPVRDKLLLPPPWGQLATAAFPVWVQLHKEGSPRKVLFLFSKRGLTEYQVNLIAGKEKELLNRPAGRTMLCSSTHHLKYLSFWNTFELKFYLFLSFFLLRIIFKNVFLSLNCMKMWTPACVEDLRSTSLASDLHG